MAKVIPMKKRPERPLLGGCCYVVAVGHKGKDAFKVFCNKLTAENDQYCPKHRLIVDDEGKEPERRREERRKMREYQQAENTALALSPLKAYNPRFDDVIAGTGYQPAERKK